ncbi:MAG: hypothetical protein LAT82_00665 [Nanoarchaeota archaeon]|nr:hypothetical protein [Nanoarchaeota archaeon]
MRIGIVGKGGSGKTTITSLLATYFSSTYLNRELAVIDADLNSHLNTALNIEFDKIPIGERIEELTQYVHNGRCDICVSKMIGTTPPNHTSKFIQVNSNDYIFKEFFVKKNNILFTKVGNYSKEDIGSNCYHSKLNSLEILLHHLIDKKDEIVLIDSTAGSDILGTSLFMSYDVLFFIVEPTLKSIQVCSDFVEKLVEENSNLTNICIIGNKITNKEDEEFIKSQLKNNSILKDSKLFLFPLSTKFRKIEQGLEISLQEIVNEYHEILHSIEVYITSLSSKNWNNYLQKLVELHTKISKSWYNDYYGEDISNVDLSQFTYEKIIFDNNK